MILVDSSVWIDSFRSRNTPQTRALEQLAQTQDLATGDLVLAEVLQGFRREGQFRSALATMSRFPSLTVSDHRVALAAARNYRDLRARGVTVRKTIDVLIATRCVLDGIPLLFGDRDFLPFVEHFGLLPVLAADPGLS